MASCGTKLLTLHILQDCGSLFLERLMRVNKQSGLVTYSKIQRLWKIKAVQYVPYTPFRGLRTKSKTKSPLSQKEKVALWRSDVPAKVIDVISVFAAFVQYNDSWECTAYATGNSYDIDALRDHFIKSGGRFTVSTLPKDATDDLRVSRLKSDDAEDGEVFFFGRYGSFVTWNVTESEKINLRHIVKQFQKGCYPEEVVDTETEQLDYIYTTNDTGLSTGEIDIHLNKNSEEETMALEKYALSNAMALSVKLAMWEVALDNFVDSTSNIPEDLLKGRKLRMSRKMVLQKMGEVLMLRNQINLSSDLLMTPDFYWDRENLEQLYTKMCNYLEIGRRTKRTNEKLNHCSDMIELLRNHLNEQHSSRLELAIIGLIAIEVIIGLNIDWKSLMLGLS